MTCSSRACTYARSCAPHEHPRRRRDDPHPGDRAAPPATSQEPSNEDCSSSSPPTTSPTSRPGRPRRQRPRPTGTDDIPAVRAGDRRQNLERPGLTRGRSTGPMPTDVPVAHRSHLSPKAPSGALLSLRDHVDTLAFSLPAVPVHTTFRARKRVCVTNILAYVHQYD